MSWNDDWSKAINSVKDDPEMIKLKKAMLLEYLCSVDGQAKLKELNIGVKVSFKRKGKWGESMDAKTALIKIKRKSFIYEDIKFTTYDLNSQVEMCDVSILQADVSVVGLKIINKLSGTIKMLFNIRIVI